MRWSVRDIARQAVEDGIVDSIHYSSVCLILNEFDLKPHHIRYWLNSQDPDFETKAASILWYYERAQSLAREGVLVVCMDEKTGIQALGRRHPDHPVRPGLPLRREFEYVRHGSVHLQLALTVATGDVWARNLPRNDHQHCIDTLERLDHRYRDAKRIELILDNGSSHTAKETKAWFVEHSDRIRPHFTPTHASWLDQAELALGAISRRYIKNAVVDSRRDLIKRIRAGISEYNKLYAHPFDWSFTRHAMHEWYRKKDCPGTSSTLN